MIPRNENDLSVRNARMKHSLLAVYLARRDRVSEKLRIRLRISQHAGIEAHQIQQVV